jgi:aminoglycoside phosphotransferase (APT) family kinase protein
VFFSRVRWVAGASFRPALSTLPMIDPAGIVALINLRHGTHFRLGRPMGGGESGCTHSILDEQGSEFILKWSEGSEFRVRQTLEITRRLRSVGYPAPEFIVASNEDRLRYLVQRMLPGRPGVALTPALLRRLVELNRLQEEAASAFAEGWPARIVESVEKGFEDWCVHDSLATHSAQTAALLVELKRTSSRVASAQFRTTDAVHFDFSTANILVQHGEVSGVIDWNGCCAGDRGFDLTTLAFYALEDSRVAPWLLDRAREVSGPSAVALYLSHMIVRQLDWSIRNHNQPTVARYLNISRRALRLIQELRERPR